MRTLKLTGRLFATCLLSLGLCASAQTTTTTTLTVSSGGIPVSTVASGSLITLKASVATTATTPAPVTPGQVNFCNALAAHCTDINLLGTAQLLANGTATLKFFPGIGTYSYKAVFVGTTTNAASSSLPSPLTVPVPGGLSSSTTTIVSSGVPGNYTLTATVLGKNGVVAPTGNVTFNDTTTNTVFGAPVSLIPTVPVVSGVSLLNSSNYLTGAGSELVATGDFNGDGIPDLAATAENADTLTILLGHGDGAFTASTINFPANSLPAYLVARDFNNDGKLDLAVILVNSSVEILLGNGDGTFTPGQIINTVVANGVGGLLVAGDFNNDGNIDLAEEVGDPTATPNSFSYHLVFLQGHGDGTFTMSPTRAPMNNSWDMTTGDFNGDGKLDIASTTIFAGTTVDILLGNGDGTFTAGASINTGGQSLGICAADLESNGITDLVTTGSSITVLIGDGHGNFTQLPVDPGTVGGVSYIVAVADFNKDGKPDLVRENYVTNTIYLSLGNGDGTFTLSSTTPFPQNFDPFSFAIADFNGDGRPDIATAAVDANGPLVNDDQVRVYLAQSGATATATINNVSVTGVRTHFADAAYPGDALYTSSLSGLIPLINPNAINGTLAVSPEPSIYDEDNFTLTATVTPAVNNFTPTGTVTFFIDGTQVGLPVTLSPSTGTSAVASLLVPAGVSYAVGSHTIAANYSGDPNSSAITLTGTHAISLIQTRTILFLGTPMPPGGYVYGDDYNAQVIPENVGTLAVLDDPTGSIIMSIDGVQNCVLIIGGGTCFNPLADAAPNQPLTAVYQGDATHAASTSAPLLITVLQDTLTTSTTTLAASSGGNPVLVGQPITFTTTVTGQFAPPVGTITFLDGATPLGSPVTLTTGTQTSTASITTSALSLGTHTLTARYTPTTVIIPPSTPTTDFAASVSPAISQLIIPPPTPDFTITITPNPLVAGVGEPGIAIVTVTPINGWTSDVTLACPASASLPYESTCGLGDTTIHFHGVSETTALELTSIAPHDCGSSTPYFTGALQMKLKFGGAALAGLLIWLLPRRRRMLKGLLLALLCVLPGVMGCGRCTDLGTRPAAYNIPITATGVGTGVTHTVNVKLQVVL